MMVPTVLASRLTPISNFPEAGSSLVTPSVVVITTSPLVTVQVPVKDSGPLKRVTAAVVVVPD